MITRCSGNNCPIKGTCYRWVMPAADDKAASMQSMYSILHGTCKNHWAVARQENAPAVDAGPDAHARLLQAMIQRVK